MGTSPAGVGEAAAVVTSAEEPRDDPPPEEDPLLEELEPGPPSQVGAAAVTWPPEPTALVDPEFAVALVPPSAEYPLVEPLAPLARPCARPTSVPVFATSAAPETPVEACEAPPAFSVGQDEGGEDPQQAGSPPAHAVLEGLVVGTLGRFWALLQPARINKMPKPMHAPSRREDFFFERRPKNPTNRPKPNPLEDDDF